MVRKALIFKKDINLNGIFLFDRKRLQKLLLSVKKAWVFVWTKIKL